MADTFFGFDTSLDNGDRAISPDDLDCLETEEEYDALNDETFGALEDSSCLDDWEQQHEQYAEIAENSKRSDSIVNSLNKLVFEEPDAVWSYINPSRNGEILSKIEPRNDPIKLFNKAPIPKKVCTVEELERGLLNSQHQSHGTPQPSHLPQPQFRPMMPPMHRMPPGLQMGLPPHVNMPPMPHNFPPGLVRLLPPPHFMQGGPGMMYPPGNQLPFNFPPPPRNIAPQTPQRNLRYRPELRQNFEPYQEDEYSGLMTNREKQWLLNIQLLQLNTGTPYFDDYYYTVFKERRVKHNKENQPLMDRSQRHGRVHRNSDRSENSNPLQPKVYTPLQFENSLGKLQCGSVTAPRKIIDMEIFQVEKDSENTSTSRDTRKIKQLLLELEALYSLMLKAEDLRNPLAINNLEKLRELKQKQRLRELDVAPTPEQKQEILKLLQQESIPVIESQYDYIARVINGLLQEEKFASFLAIRKGKMLLLRVLPHLTIDSFSSQICEVWSKVLLSVPTVGRRDSLGDNLLPRLSPFFKRYIQTSEMSNIVELAKSLVEVLKAENSRSTPFSGKAPLHFVVSNKFGSSALATMLVRTEYLISSNNTTGKQQHDWFNFINSWADVLAVVSNVATPLDLIPLQIFGKHVNRISNLAPDKRCLLEKWFVDSN